jgi:hypothetical protein
MAVPKPIERSNRFQSPTDDPFANLISEKTLARHTTTIPFLPFPFINFPNSSAPRPIHACYSRVVNPITKSTSLNGLDRAADPAAINRAAVNKANAQKSTGPRTEAGKQLSSLNALRHGLTGQTIVLPTEDHSAYERHSQSFLNEYRPKDATETQLVQSLIDTSWRMNRAATVETNLFSLGIVEMEDRLRANHPEAEAALAMALAFREHMRAFASISTQSQRLARQFERTLAQLRQIQAERRAIELSQLDNAAKILKMHKHEHLSSEPAPYNPADDGFVFSNTEIETFLRREERKQQANNHDFYAHA